MPADASALAHTLKGSARAIGAFAVADAAARLEAAIARGFDTSAALAELGEAVAAGAGGDRGGSAPFLSGKRSVSAKIPVKCRLKVFVPTAGAVRIDPL